MAQTLRQIIEEKNATYPNAILFDYLCFKMYAQIGGTQTFRQLVNASNGKLPCVYILHQSYLLLGGALTLTQIEVNMFSFKNLDIITYLFYNIYLASGGALTLNQIQADKWNNFPNITLRDCLIFECYYQISGTGSLRQAQIDRWNNYNNIVLRDYLTYCLAQHDYVNFLLDDFPSAAVAYSVRKLSSTYLGDCMRVRRSSDNQESDIRFFSNWVDEDQIITFLNGSDGYIVKWYDQSGNANHLTQTTALSQIKIATAGVVNKLDGKPVIQFNGSSNFMNLTNAFNLPATTSYSTFKLIKPDNASVSGRRNPTMCHGSGSTYDIFDNGTSLVMTGSSGGSYISANRYSTTDRQILNGNWINNAPSVNSKVFVNKINMTFSVPVATTGYTFDRIGNMFITSYQGGYIQEYIFYISNKITDSSLIADNINASFNVF